VLHSSPPSAEYALSELGLELIPAIQAIIAVGEKLKTARHRAEISDRTSACAG